MPDGSGGARWFCGQARTDSRRAGA
jgi:hypothetical protein